MQGGIDAGAGPGRERDRPGGDEDALERLLDDPHCRRTLERLRGADEPVAVSTLARHVVADLTDTPVDDVSEEVQRRVATWLHHGQLPVLQAHDVVDFDADAGEVHLVRDG